MGFRGPSLRWLVALCCLGTAAVLLVPRELPAQEQPPVAAAGRLLLTAVDEGKLTPESAGALLAKFWSLPEVREKLEGALGSAEKWPSVRAHAQRGRPGQVFTSGDPTSAAVMLRALHGLGSAGGGAREAAKSLYAELALAGVLDTPGLIAGVLEKACQEMPEAPAAELRSEVLDAVVAPTAELVRAALGSAASPEHDRALLRAANALPAVLRGRLSRLLEEDPSAGLRWATVQEVGDGPFEVSSPQVAAACFRLAQLSGQVSFRRAWLKASLDTPGQLERVRRARAVHALLRAEPTVAQLWLDESAPLLLQEQLLAGEDAKTYVQTWVDTLFLGRPSPNGLLLSDRDGIEPVGLHPLVLEALRARFETAQLRRGKTDEPTRLAVARGLLDLSRRQSEHSPRSRVALGGLLLYLAGRSPGGIGLESGRLVGAEEWRPVIGEYLNELCQSVETDPARWGACVGLIENSRDPEWAKPSSRAALRAQAKARILERRDALGALLDALVKQAEERVGGLADLGAAWRELEPLQADGQASASRTPLPALESPQLAAARQALRQSASAPWGQPAVWEAMCDPAFLRSPAHRWIAVEGLLLLEEHELGDAWERVGAEQDRQRVWTALDLWAEARTRRPAGSPRPGDSEAVEAFIDNCATRLGRGALDAAARWELATKVSRGLAPSQGAKLVQVLSALLESPVSRLTASTTETMSAALLELARHGHHVPFDGVELHSMAVLAEASAAHWESWVGALWLRQEGLSGAEDPPGKLEVQVRRLELGRGVGLTPEDLREELETARASARQLLVSRYLAGPALGEALESSPRNAQTAACLGRLARVGSPLDPDGLPQEAFPRVSWNLALEALQQSTGVLGGHEEHLAGLLEKQEEREDKRELLRLLVYQAQVGAVAGNEDLAAARAALARAEAELDQADGLAMAAEFEASARELLHEAARIQEQRQEKLVRVAEAETRRTAAVAAADEKEARAKWDEANAAELRAQAEELRTQAQEHEAAVVALTAQAVRQEVELLTDLVEVELDPSRPAEQIAAVYSSLSLEGAQAFKNDYARLQGSLEALRERLDWKVGSQEMLPEKIHGRVGLMVVQVQAQLFASLIQKLDEAEKELDEAIKEARRFALVKFVKAALQVIGTVVGAIFGVPQLGMALGAAVGEIAGGVLGKQSFGDIALGLVDNAAQIGGLVCSTEGASKWLKKQEWLQDLKKGGEKFAAKLTADSKELLECLPGLVDRSTVEEACGRLGLSEGLCTRISGAFPKGTGGGAALTQILKGMGYDAQAALRIPFEGAEWGRLQGELKGILTAGNQLSPEFQAALADVAPDLQSVAVTNLLAGALADVTGPYQQRVLQSFLAKIETEVDWRRAEVEAELRLIIPGVRAEVQRQRLLDHLEQIKLGDRSNAVVRLRAKLAPWNQAVQESLDAVARQMQEAMAPVPGAVETRVQRATRALHALKQGTETLATSVSALLLSGEDDKTIALREELRKLRAELSQLDLQVAGADLRVEAGKVDVQAALALLRKSQLMAESGDLAAEAASIASYQALLSKEAAELEQAVTGAEREAAALRSSEARARHAAARAGVEAARSRVEEARASLEAVRLRGALAERTATYVAAQDEHRAAALQASVSAVASAEAACQEHLDRALGDWREVVRHLRALPLDHLQEQNLRKELFRVRDALAGKLRGSLALADHWYLEKLWRAPTITTLEYPLLVKDGEASLLLHVEMTDAFDRMPEEKDAVGAFVAVGTVVEGLPVRWGHPRLVGVVIKAMGGKDQDFKVKRAWQQDHTAVDRRPIERVYVAAPGSKAEDVVKAQQELTEGVGLGDAAFTRVAGVPLRGTLQLELQVVPGLKLESATVELVVAFWE